jgi:hypothetical protein
MKIECQLDYRTILANQAQPVHAVLKLTAENLNKEIIMPESHQVHCINKTHRTSPHERISPIGGVNGDGSRWKVTQPDAISGIESNKWHFYVSERGHTVDVIVAIHNGNKYLKTRNDGVHPDNLLCLPECP